MLRFRWFKNRVSLAVLLVIAGLAAYVGYVQPSWAMTPLRSVAERVILELGAGVIPVALWCLSVLFLLAFRAKTLFRRWQIVLGTGILVVAVQGALGFFQGQLPLVGYASLGGSQSDYLKGSTVAKAVQVGIVGLAAIWVIVPAISWKVVRGMGKGAGKSAAASAQAYQRAPLHKGFNKLLFATVRGGAVAVREYRERRNERALGREVGTLLTGKTPAPAPQGAAPASAAKAVEQGRATDDRPQTPAVPSQRRAPTQTAVLEDGPKPKSAVRPPTAAGPLWRLPNAELLSPGVASAPITEDHHTTAQLIEETLAQHGVEVRVAEIRPGPTVTMFGLVPGWNRKARGAYRKGAVSEGEEVVEQAARTRVKVDSILAREKDLALALAAPSLRLEAPVPGESVVGVEVPNRNSNMVTIRSVMETPEYERTLENDGLPVALGLATAGEPVVIDLLKMPHLLIAGATGSGKSVCINSIISSLITHQQPSKVRLMLVDPKRVELTPYNGIPHLVTPVVVEPDRVVRLLRGAIQEMLRRYKLLEEAGVRNIQSYNRSPKAKEPMPYFVICLDELADLMMTASFDVEQSICRLAQLGRATGIHMVVATQRPSVDVVTGLIKANFPSRIAFAVASQVDSRTILDSVGAERLLGRGDMLFLSSDSPKPRRVQGVFISEEETAALAEHWRQHEPLPVPELSLEDLAREAEMAAAVQDVESGADLDDNDSLFDRAVQLAGASRQLSTSLLQRRLRIGYPRAARLMEQLEDEGIVAPSSEPGKPREVLYRPDN